jgi:nitroimidazol reductase NimA-like FMN-containing flavoprotein (pyridoxamine 5'-phosphate oxidase superfamily)
MAQASPNILELEPDEITAILARNRVGRIAYSSHDRVDIEPMHYVYSQGWIYGRTSRGAKLQTLEKNRWVAFEVDEVTSLFDWRSVVVHGGVYLLEGDTSAESSESYTRALELLRGLLPSTFREDDPVPHRDVVFRIAVQEATGRRAIAPAP